MKVLEGYFFEVISYKQEVTGSSPVSPIKKGRPKAAYFNGARHFPSLAVYALLSPAQNDPPPLSRRSLGEDGLPGRSSESEDRKRPGQPCFKCWVSWVFVAVGEFFGRL